MSSLHTARNWFRRLAPFLKAVVAVALFYWLYRSGRLDFSQFPPFGPAHVPGLVLLLASMLLQAARWWLLLRVQSIDIGIGRATTVSWISQFFTQVLPGAAGGEIVRALYAVRDAPQLKLAATSSVLVDRAYGMLAMLVLGFAAAGGLWLTTGRTSLVLGRMTLASAGLLAGTALACATLQSAALWKLATRILPVRLSGPIGEVLSQYRRHGRSMAACLGLSLVASILLMAGFSCAAVIVDPAVNWRTVFAIAPLVFVISVVPLAPGGIGVAETAASLLFAEFGVASGGTIMLVVRIWMLLVRLPGGVIYVFSSRRQNGTGGGGGSTPPAGDRS